MLGNPARTSSSVATSWLLGWGEEREEEVSFVAKVSFTGPLLCLSRELT